MYPPASILPRIELAKELMCLIHTLTLTRAIWWNYLMVSALDKMVNLGLYYRPNSCEMAIEERSPHVRVYQGKIS